jgi:hypothetical protein
MEGFAMTISALLGLVIWLLIVGLVLWVILLVIDRVPMEATFKQVAKGVVIVVGVIILLLQVIPLLEGLI